MNEKHLLPQIVEDEDDLGSVLSNDNVSIMSRGELESYNQILEDQVKLLKDRLNQVEDLSIMQAVKHEDDSFIKSQSFKAKQLEPVKESQNQNKNQDIKTVNNLQQNVLSYPSNHVNQKSDDSSYIKNFFLSTKRLERETDLIQERLERENPTSKQQLADKSNN